MSQASGCVKTCTLRGCENFFAINFAPDSIWWQGAHRIILDTNEGSVSCQFDPYFPDQNGNCLGSLSGVTSFRRGGIRINRTPESVRLQIDSEIGDGSSNVGVYTKSFTPDYEKHHPNGRGCGHCDQATVTLTLEGNGEPAVEERRERLVWSPDVGVGGAGGRSGSSEDGGYFLPEARGIGQACVENYHCSAPQLCSDELLGVAPSCTQGCADESDCPDGTECAEDLYNDNFTTVSGFCQRPCNSDEDCEAFGSICASNNGQKYCY